MALQSWCLASYPGVPGTRSWHCLRPGTLGAPAWLQRCQERQSWTAWSVKAAVCWMHRNQCDLFACERMHPRPRAEVPGGRAISQARVCKNTESQSTFVLSLCRCPDRAEDGSPACLPASPASGVLVSRNAIPTRFSERSVCWPFVFLNPGHLAQEKLCFILENGIHFSQAPCKSSHRYTFPSLLCPRRNPKLSVRVHCRSTCTVEGTASPPGLSFALLACP